MNAKIGIVLLGIASLIACGGGENAPEAKTPTTGSSTSSLGPSASFDAQAAEGQKLYAANCAGCHGDAGEGTKDAPKVVGVSQGALPLDPPTGAKYRKEKFKTAADVAGFVVKNMPPGKGGSLSEDQYWAILAFDLKANGVKLDKHLDGNTAAGVVIHP